MFSLPKVRFQWANFSEKNNSFVSLNFQFISLSAFFFVLRKLVTLLTEEIESVSVHLKFTFYPFHSRRVKLSYSKIIQ